MSAGMKHKTETRSCEHCHREFSAQAGNVKRGWGRFCSHTCASRHAQPRVVDLTTSRGRHLARKSGLDVPKRKTGTLAQDFWSRTRQVGDCIEWTGPTNYGYGRYGINGQHWRAHRWAYTQAHGPIPDGLVVMHSCDNRRCVNPAHLSTGTQLENRTDAVQKGRTARGAAAGSMLTEQDVRTIRANHRKHHRSGEWTTAWIAHKYGIEKSGVRKIVSGQNWKYVAS